MTIQWTLIASFLYFEIVVIILLLLPLVSPRIWRSLFRSRIFQAFAGKSTLFFSISIAVLVMFFVESIREMNKYSVKEPRPADVELQLSLKLFRSQRNYYISGFALFLWFVIRRLVILLLSQADLQSEIERTMREAQNATDKAEKLLREQSERNIREAADNLRNIEKEKLEKELNELREQLSVTEDELRHAKRELATVKEQALSVTEEYEKLHEEHAALQKMMLKDVGNGLPSTS